MIEQSGSGKYVIHQEYLKDPVVKLHIPQVYMPSCENNHSQENMVDKEKANRVLNQLSRKKNNDKILERSRKQLEQCQIELAQVFREGEGGTQPQNFRKANARRIILSKKLVSDIQRVNKQIADVINNLVYQPADAIIEAHNSKIRKQQQIINSTIVSDVHKSIHILNTLPVNSDPNTFRQKYDQFLKVQQVMINQQWEQKKELEDLLAERERVKERVEKEIKEFLKKSQAGSDANAHLEHINESVMKFFRLIFGTDYSMRLRSDRILASTDPEHLKRQFEMAHTKGKEENMGFVERKKIEKRERKVLNTNSSENEETDREREPQGEQQKEKQAQSHKKVTINSEKTIQLRVSGEFNKTENSKKDSILKESTLTLPQPDSPKALPSDNSKTQIVEKDNNLQVFAGTTSKGKEEIAQKVTKQEAQKRKDAGASSKDQTTRSSWSPGRKSTNSSKNILRGNKQGADGRSSTKSMNQSLLKSQTIKKSLSKIQKTEQYDPFEAEKKWKRESLLAQHIPSYQAKQLDILEHSFQKDVLQHLFDFFFNPISESVEYDFQEHNWDQLFNQFKNSKLSQPSAALSTSQTTLLPPIKQPNVTAGNQSKVSVNPAEQQQHQSSQSEGSTTTAEESVYSKEFYQYLREYQMVIAEQKGSSREEKLIKIGEILAKSQKQLEFYEAQLELSEPQLRRHLSHQNTRLAQSPLLRLRSSNNNPDQGSPSLLLSNSSNRDQLSQRDQQQQLQSSQKPNQGLLAQNSSQIVQQDSVIPILNLSQSQQQPSQQQQHSSNNLVNSVSQFNPSLQLDKNNSSNSIRAPAGQLLSPKKVAFQQQNDLDDDGTDDTNKKSDAVLEAPKHKAIVKLPQLKKLKQSSRLAVNEKMDQYLSQVKSQETSEYMQSVQQLYKNCRLESFKTKKVHIESIRKNRQFARNFNKIDKNLSYVLSL